MAYNGSLTKINNNDQNQKLVGGMVAGAWCHALILVLGLLESLDIVLWHLFPLIIRIP